MFATSNLLVCFVVMHYLDLFLLFIVVRREELHHEPSILLNIMPSPSNPANMRGPHTPSPAIYI